MAANQREHTQGWKWSRYTSAIAGDSGEVLLHNSFMGALARIPAEKVPLVRRFLGGSSEAMHGPSMYRTNVLSEMRQDIQESDLNDPALQELCDGGFFVPSDLDEQTVISELVDRERNSGFTLIIMPHENCNFRCTYCYESFERGKMSPEVVSGLKAWVARKVTGIDALSVGWFGGEPLLAPDVIWDLSDSFIKSCTERGISYAGSMTTNGYFLTPAVAAKALKHGIRRYQVTLDGPAATHDNLRKLTGGGKTYSKILENLVALRQTDESFHVTVRVNFTQSTLAALESFLQEIESLFRGDSRFSLDFHAVGAWGGANDASLDICDSSTVERVKLALLEKSLALGADRSIRSSLGSHGTICYAGKESSIVVGSDGTVYKCTVAFSDPRNHVGKLTKSGDLIVDQARWNLWTKLDDKDTTKCSSCSFNPSCQSRTCPLVAMTEREPPCPMTGGTYVALVKLAASGTSVIPGSPPKSSVFEQQSSEIGFSEATHV